MRGHPLGGFLIWQGLIPIKAGILYIPTQARWLAQ